MRTSHVVYVASPVTAYGTPARNWALAAIRKQASPDAVILDPAEMFCTNDEWLAEWPDIVRTLDELVIVPAVDGTIGAGVLREIADALAFGVPVTLWRPRGARIPWGSFRVAPIMDGSPSRVASVTSRYMRKAS
jgi:hypothetical protein